MLLSLVNKVIQKSNFSFKKPRLEEKKTSSKEENLEIEDEMPDLINNEIDYGDETNEKSETKPTANNNPNAQENTMDDGSGILFSNISQEEWQRELEKVSSKLKFDYAKINMNATSEWREHIPSNKLKKAEKNSPRQYLIQEPF